MRAAIKASEAAKLIPDGASVMIGGFLAVGTPERLIHALVGRNARDLSMIANDTARPGEGIGKLIDAGCVAHVVTSLIMPLVLPETASKTGQTVGKGLEAQ
jgi:acetate CoA/acetoacetate CoA-transferase alpha subunit